MKRKKKTIKRCRSSKSFLLNFNCTQMYQLAFVKHVRSSLYARAHSFACFAVFFLLLSLRFFVRYRSLYVYRSMDGCLFFLSFVTFWSMDRFCHTLSDLFFSSLFWLFNAFSINGYATADPHLSINEREKRKKQTYKVKIIIMLGVNVILINK